VAGPLMATASRPANRNEIELGERKAAGSVITRELTGRKCGRRDCGVRLGTSASRCLIRALGRRNYDGQGTRVKQLAAEIRSLICSSLATDSASVSHESGFSSPAEQRSLMSLRSFFVRKEARTKQGLTFGECKNGSGQVSGRGRLVPRLSVARRYQSVRNDGALFDRRLSRGGLIFRILRRECITAGRCRFVGAILLLVAFFPLIVGSLLFFLLSLTLGVCVLVLGDR